MGKQVNQVFRLLTIITLAAMLSACAAHILGGGNAANRGSGQSEKDLQIQSRVNTALVRHKLIDATSIRVRVRNGIATLSGKVASASMRSRAISTVRRVRGVRGVRSRLRVAK